MPDPAIEAVPSRKPSLPSRLVMAVAIAVTLLFLAIPILVLQDETVSLWPPRKWPDYLAILDLVIGLALTGYMTVGYAIRVMHVLWGNDIQEAWDGSLYGFPGTRRRIAFNLGIGYLLMVYLFAVLYRLISIADSTAYFVNGSQRSLSLFDAVYFSLTTATTVGLGDITPASVWAKSMVMAEIVASLAYAAFLLSVGAARLAEPDRSRDR